MSKEIKSRLLYSRLRLLNLVIPTPTNEMFESFHKHITEHINLVKQLFIKLKDKCPELEGNYAGTHDELKLQTPELIPMTWIHYGKEMRKSDPEHKFPENVQESIAYAVMHHILNSKHHPCYWSGYCHINNLAKHIENKPVVVNNMPDVFIAEMVSDWSAMGILYGDSASKWFESKNGNHWIFSEEITNKINKYIKILES